MFLLLLGVAWVFAHPVPCGATPPRRGWLARLFYCFSTPCCLSASCCLMASCCLSASCGLRSHPLLGGVAPWGRGGDHAEVSFFPTFDFCLSLLFAHPVPCGDTPPRRGWLTRFSAWGLPGVAWAFAHPVPCGDTPPRRGWLARFSAWGLPGGCLGFCPPRPLRGHPSREGMADAVGVPGGVCIGY